MSPESLTIKTVTLAALTACTMFTTNTIAQRGGYNPNPPVVPVEVVGTNPQHDCPIIVQDLNPLGSYHNFEIWSGNHDFTEINTQTSIELSKIEYDVFQGSGEEEEEEGFDLQRLQRNTIRITGRTVEGLPISLSLVHGNVSIDQTFGPISRHTMDLSNIKIGHLPWGESATFLQVISGGSSPEDVLENGRLILPAGHYYLDNYAYHSSIDYLTSTHAIRNKNNVYGCAAEPEFVCPELSVELCAVSQNFAYGYDDEATISVLSVSNGTAPLTYEWNDQSEEVSINVNVAQSEVFTVTVNDADGCTGTATHTLNVVDVVTGVNNNNGGGTAFVIMTKKGKVKRVPAQHVVGNLAAGYTLGLPGMEELDFSGGLCGGVAHKTSSNSTFSDVGDANIYPNPTNGNLVLVADYGIVGNVNVLDLSGRVMKNIQLSQSSILDFNISDLDNGIYFVQFNDLSGKSVSLKVTKQ